MDEMDRKLLTLLQENGRMSNAALARKVGLAPSAVLERVRKLESQGPIRGFAALMDAAVLGLPLLAFIQVKSQDGCWSDETSRRLSEIPYVMEVHSVTGDDCYLVKVRARDTNHLNLMMKDYFKSISSIISTRTTIVLATSKESCSMPIEETDCD